MTTAQEIKQLVAEVLEQDVSTVRLEDHFVRDLAASSLDIVTLVMRIEQHYGLAETPDELLAQIETVHDLVELVRGLHSGEVSLAEEASVATTFADIAIASDHAGVALKDALVTWLKQRGYEVLDLGPEAGLSVDYPDYARRVTSRLQAGEATRGVLICGTGLGMSIAANRQRGVRAAMVSEPVSARFARQHNDANVLCLGARMIGVELAQACVETFLTTAFDPGDDGRHQRRIQAIEPR